MNLAKNAPGTCVGGALKKGYKKTSGLVPEVAAAGLIVGVHLGEGFFLSPVSLSDFPLGGVDFVVFKSHFLFSFSLGGFLPLSGIIIAQDRINVKHFFFIFCGWKYGIQLQPSALSCGNRKILGVKPVCLSFHSPRELFLLC